jgi:hypothetical protein
MGGCGELASALHRIANEQRAHRVCSRRQRIDRLHGADFVVHLHHRDEAGAIGDYHVGID